jgi:uncharacterized protein
MQIGTCSAIAGKVTRGAINLAHFNPGNSETKELEAPVFIAQGNSDGPKVLLMAGLSGLDTLSIYFLYAFLEKIDLDELAGTLVVLPTLNTPGYYSSSKAHPYDGKVIETSFPGNVDGSVSEQIAAQIMEQVIKDMDLVVYFQDEETGLSSEIYTKIYAAPELVEQNDTLVQRAIGLGVEINMVDMPVEGQLPVEIEQRFQIPTVKVITGGKKSLTLEKGWKDAHRILKNMLSMMAMTKDQGEKPDTQYVIKGFDGVYSLIGGIWESAVTLGSFLKKGEKIGVVLNPETGEKQEIHAGFDGKIFQLNETVRIVKDDKLYVMLPITDEKGKEASFMTKEALRVITNGNK